MKACILSACRRDLLRQHLEAGGARRVRHDDTNVMLLLSHPGLRTQDGRTAVGTAQVAPTIPNAMGINPSALDAVRAEGTNVLPAVQLH